MSKPPYLKILSPREIELTRLLGYGLTVKVISGRLNLSMSTVRTHAHNIQTKLNLHSRPELVWWTIRNGLCTLEDYPK